MSFRNLQVDVDALPEGERIEFLPMAPAYAREVLTQGGLTWGALFLLAALPAVLVIRPVADKLGIDLSVLRLRLSLLALIPLVLGATIVPLSVWRTRVAGFALREHDLAYRFGLFFRKVVILPFHRVQHAEVSSGPLQRRFGLASLKLYTAGASGVDLRIDGLTADRAADLRDHVTARSEGPGGSPA